MTVNDAMTGAYGTSPFADLSEYAPPTVRVPFGKIYSEIHPTDARAVEVFVAPNHVNLIPNPACRVVDDGWNYSGFNDPFTIPYDWTFVSSTDVDNKNSLDSIINRTTSAVTPDPATVSAYLNGQIVYVSGVDVWLEVDDTATLTVAQASAEGLSISGDTAGFKTYDTSFTQVYLDEESWVGQAIHTVGVGTVHYEDQNHGLIYVGPTDQGMMPTGLVRSTDWWEPAKATAEYTFSVYAKGNENTFVQLSMYGFRPKDPAGEDISPEDTPYVWAHSPAYRMNSIDDEYDRFSVRTTSRLDDISEGTTSFADCWWVKVEVTVSKDIDSIAPEAWLSAFMLDSTESAGPYFDGDMEEEGRDDFFWVSPVESSDPAAEQRPWFSAYYCDRLVRTAWLYGNVYQVVPANRPVHVYFHDRSHPYNPESPAFTDAPTWV